MPKGETAVVPTAVEQAYDAIKHEILANVLKPGEPVPIDRFVRELRFSRTPVREAILRLEREGLIEVRPRLGTFVSHLDLRRIQEMYRVRRLLEGEAAKEASVRAPVDEIRALKGSLERLNTGRSADYRAISEAGQGVHRLVVEHCGNEVLRAMIHSLQDHFTRFRSLSIEMPEKVLSSHREHIGIVDALLARDAERVQQLIHEHFDHAARYLLAGLLEGPKPGQPRVTVSARR